MATVIECYVPERLQNKWLPPEWRGRTIPFSVLEEESVLRRINLGRWRCFRQVNVSHLHFGVRAAPPRFIGLRWSFFARQGVFAFIGFPTQKGTRNHTFR